MLYNRNRGKIINLGKKYNSANFVMKIYNSLIVEEKIIRHVIVSRNDKDT